jgi:hypothetical protein
MAADRFLLIGWPLSLSGGCARVDCESEGGKPDGTNRCAARRHFLGFRRAPFFDGLSGARNTRHQWRITSGRGVAKNLKLKKALPNIVPRSSHHMPSGPPWLKLHNHQTGIHTSSSHHTNLSSFSSYSVAFNLGSFPPASPSSNQFDWPPVDSSETPSLQQQCGTYQPPQAPKSPRRVTTDTNRSGIFGYISKIPSTQYPLRRVIFVDSAELAKRPHHPSPPLIPSRQPQYTPSFSVVFY